MSKKSQLNGEGVEQERLPIFATNGVVKTPFGIGIIQGRMQTSNGDHVLAVRVPVNNDNVKHLRSSNVIGHYKEGSETEKRSPSAIWCFYPKSLEVVDENKPKSRAKKG